ncbi:MAG: hypothetical protein IKT37_07845 [Clostridia bacterium]|nr:hypothetical protein [Clostridia bacterium]
MNKEKERSMVLNAVMSKFDEDRTVFIGASCGYLFIGTLKEYRVDFPKIEKEADEELKKTTIKINELIDEINAEISEENENTDGVKLNAILKKLTEVKTKLRDREVLEVYDKILNGNESGTAVIIRGSERGRYWLKKEYEEKRGGIPDEEDEEEVKDE